MVSGIDASLSLNIYTVGTVSFVSSNDARRSFSPVVFTDVSGSFSSCACTDVIAVCVIVVGKV